MKTSRLRACLTALLFTPLLLRAAPIGTTDLAGNALTGLPFTSGESYILDATPPDAPTGLDLDAASDSGSSSTDNLTNDTTPTIHGSGEAGATVTLYDTDGTTSRGSTTVGGGGTWSITATAMGAGEHTLTAKQTDAAGNPSGASDGLAIVFDISAPSVSSSVRTSASVTNASSVQFTVTFNEDVSGVDAADFSLNASGVSGASVSDVSGSNKTYSVSVNTGSGSGTLRLDVFDNDTIVDAAGNPLGGSFTAGQVYTIDRTAPTVNSIARQAGTLVNAGTNNLTFRIVFVETNTISGVDLGDFTLTTVSGNATGQIASIASGGLNAYDITIDQVSGLGSVRLDLNASGTDIVDSAGNALSGGFSTGDVYLVGSFNVFETTILPGTSGQTVMGTENLKLAQSFKTSSTGPLTLYHVAAQLGAIDGVPVPVVTINRDANGEPGEVVATLTNPATLVENKLNVWTANASLEANTNYWLVFADASTDHEFYVIVATAHTTTTGGSGPWISADPYTFATNFDGWGDSGGVLRLAMGAVSAPAISGVTAPLNGTYASGHNLDFTVSYDAPVTVDTTGGTPRLALTIGSSTVYANYESGSPGTALVFRYTVQPEDSDVDGIAVVSPIELNGGTIKGAANIDALLAFSGINTAGILIDTTSPVVESVSVPINGTYVSSENLNFTVNFSESITVNTTGGTPRLALTIGSSTMYAAYQSGSGTSALAFRYVAQAGDLDTNGVSVGSLSANGGTLRDAAGNDATLTLNSVGSTANVNIDAVAPTIASVVAPAAAYYRAGQTLSFTVNFSENIDVEDQGGTPLVSLTVGATTRQATYASGSGSAALVFSYTVQAGETDVDGIQIGETVSSNGGTLRDAAGNNAALSFTAPSLTAVRVDTTAPVTSVGAPSITLTRGGPVTFEVTYTDDQLASSTLSTAGVTVLSTGTATGTVSVSGSGSTRTVTISSIEGDGTLGISIAGATASDTAGNAAGASAASATVTIDNTAPAVALIERENPLALHTEAASVTWRVMFDEDVTGVDAGDFALSIVEGSPTGTIGAVTPVSASTYDVAVNDVSGRGRLRLDLKPAGTGIADLAGNVLADGGYTNAEFYLTGVGNVFQTTHLNVLGDVEVSSAAPTTANRAAQRFTTSADEPLTLTTVAALIGAMSGEPLPVVTIHNDMSGDIGGLVATLKNPETLTPNAVNVWTSTQLLEPNTSYWVMFSEESATATYIVKATPETENGLGAWIGSNDYAFRQGVEAMNLIDGALSIAIGATSTPTITSELTAMGTYGTALVDYTINATNLPTSFAATGLPSGLSLDAQTGTISGTPTQSGTFNVALTATNANGEGAPSTLVIEIAKAPLLVTADAATRIYGAANPTFTVSYTGFVNGDTSSALATQPTATSDATAHSPVDSYAIVPSGGSAANYTLSYANGVLSVTKAIATITFDGLVKSYTGTPVAVTTITNPTGLTVAVTYDGSSTIPSQPGHYAVSASIVDDNYKGSNSATLAIGRIPVAIEFNDLTHTYDGTAKAATALTTPSGLPIALTYDGSNTAPINAGTYEVQAIVDTATHSGSSTQTLTIEEAAQAITFTLDPLKMGSAATLSATATSMLPVSFEVVSGPATLSGNTLTPTGQGSVTVRATQAGSDNFLAAPSVDRTVEITGKMTQTIDFPEIPARSTLDGAFRLSATANSGLTVTFTLVSGPARIAGRSLIPNGTPGTVVVRASQAGNDQYAAADDVARSFEIIAEPDRVFFGDLRSTTANSTPNLRSGGKARALAEPKVGDVAAVLPSQSKAGSLLIVAPSINISALVTFTLAEDNSFTATVTQGGESPALRTVSGQLVGNVLSGAIEGTGLSFSTEVEPGTGPSAEAAGLYRSAALETAQGTTYTIIGSNNNVLVLAVTPTLTVGGTATLDTNGSFELQMPASNGEMVTLQGAVDTPTTTVAGTILVPNSAPIDFAGLQTTTTRTDRLFGLSSRGRVGAGEKILISGLVIGGSEPQPVLIRAIGPALNELGVADTLVNPRVSLFKGATLVGENDNWATADNADDIEAAAQRIGAFGLSRASKDAALLRTLAPGAYTVHVTGGEGVALVEVYDASENSPTSYQRLVDIATRGNVGTGENVLIGGLAITGNSPKRVLIRGVGPALGAQGVADVLADPVLRVYRGSTVIGQNDNWSADAGQATQITAAETATGAFHLENGSKDAAILLTLAPGNYTVHIAGVNNTTGVALVEIYEVAEEQ